jgi:hypothetical protein
MPESEGPAQVAVFQFEVFDRIARAWSLMPFRATQGYIDAAGGVALPHTRIWVPEAEVEASGVHRPATREAGTEPA